MSGETLPGLPPKAAIFFCLLIMTMSWCVLFRLILVFGRYILLETKRDTNCWQLIFVIDFFSFLYDYVNSRRMFTWGTHSFATNVGGKGSSEVLPLVGYPDLKETTGLGYMVHCFAFLLLFL